MSDGGPIAQRNEAARVVVVRSLAEQGEPAVPGLLSMLTDPSWSVRREVVAALAGLGDAALPALIAHLHMQRSSEAAIAATVDALSASLGNGTDGALLGLAERAEPALLADVAQILGRRRASAANGLLTRLTLHPDDNVAVSAIEALGKLGGRAAVDALIACVNSHNFFRTFPAIDVLGRSRDPRAVEPLTVLLRDSRYTLEAARALGRSADRRAVAPLTELLLSPADSHVRVACLSLVELLDRHRQLYGSSSTVEEQLARATSEGGARRVAQIAARADKLEKVAACRLLGALKAESATPLLLTLLDADPEVGEAAARALTEIGKASDSALSAALSEGDSKRRLALLPAVRGHTSSDAVLTCLLDPSVDVRVLACEALARIGAIAAVPALFGLLSDDQQRVVHAAVAGIQSLGANQTESLALEAATSAHQPTRRAALRVLAYFGFPSALLLFSNAIHDGDVRIVDTALQGLALLDQPEARDLVVHAASDTRPSVRASAMRALGQLSGDTLVRERVLAGIEDADPWVRYYACQALGRLGTEGAEESIRALLQDTTGQVRVAAVEALSHSASSSTLTTLRELLHHTDVDMRRAALVGIGLRGDRQSLPGLALAAGATDAATRLVALSALAGIPGEGVVPLLARAAEDSAEAVRIAAINLLAERSGREAADVLLALVSKHSERELLLSALSAALDGRVAALEAALQLADDDRAAWLVSCLSRSGAEAAPTALFRTLTSPNRAARKAAVTTLAALGTEDAHSAIEELSLHDPDPDVRTTCLLCLAP